MTFHQLPPSAGSLGEGLIGARPCPLQLCPNTTASPESQFWVPAAALSPSLPALLPSYLSLLAISTNSHQQEGAGDPKRLIHSTLTKHLPHCIWGHNDTLGL